MRTAIAHNKHTPLLTYASSDDPLLKRFLITGIERVSGRARLEQGYKRVLTKTQAGQSFWSAALEELQIRIDVDAARLAAICPTGPLVFIANHPFGVVDGLAMCHLAHQVRGDFRLLVNSALCREERIMHYLLPIDFSETRAASLANIQSKREALKKLQEHIPIVIFPAGGISTTKRIGGRATDLEWKLFMAKLVQSSQATVVPVYFPGQNSGLFQLVSQFSPTLRLSLIIREVYARMGKPLTMIVGNPIPYAELSHIENRLAMTDYLRQRTYDLSMRKS